MSNVTLHNTSNDLALFWRQNYYINEAKRKKN
jgi:hypothetical protein